MLKEAIEFIQKTAQGEQIELYDGHEKPEQFVTKPVYLPPAEPTAKAIPVASLQSIIDYLEANRDELDPGTLAIVVESPTSVVLVGCLTGRHRLREYFMTATAELPQILFDRYVEREDMQIMLMSRFVPSTGPEGNDCADAVKLVSTVMSGTTRNIGDDGVQQEVTVSRGAATKARDLVKKVYYLAPYRTFTEVEQPFSPFVLRIRGDEESIHCGLFEADGGAWKLIARHRIAGWLRGALSARDIDVTVFA